MQASHACVILPIRAQTWQAFVETVPTTTDFHQFVSLRSRILYTIYICLYFKIIYYCCSATKLCMTLQPHAMQHARLPCPPPTPGAYSDWCALSWWCHPNIQPLLPPSLPAFNLSEHQGLFQWVSSLHQVVKVFRFHFLWLQNHWRW